MDKRQIILASVKKLVGLGISDREIVQNLKDVNISEQEALELIAEAHRSLRGEGMGRAQEPKPEEESEEAVYQGVVEAIEGEEGKLAEQKPKASKARQKEAAQVREAPAVDISVLWERGILATVDSRLADMERIRRDLDKVIDDRIRAELSKELKKMDVMFDSQRTLLTEKISAHLESKAKEVSDVIKSRTDELRQASREVQQDLSQLKREKSEAGKLSDSIEAKVAELDRTRTTLVSDVNRSLLEMQGKFEEFLFGAQSKISETDERVNRTLELASKITEGMIKDAQEKIDALALEKNERLEAEMRKRLKEIDSIRARVQPEAVEAKLKELEKLVVGAQKDVDAFTSHLQKEIAAQTEKLFASSFAAKDAELTKLVKAKTAELEAIPKKIDLESLKVAKEELDIFKDQFVNVVKKNVADFNKAKELWTARLEANDKALQQHIKSIDDKIAELTEFEKSFADEMGVVLEQAAPKQESEKPAAKKPAKK